MINPAARRYLKMARQIAERKRDFISYDYHDSPITREDFDALEALVGEVIRFDDGRGFTPTAVTRNERVVFLCFAAVVPPSTRNDNG